MKKREAPWNIIGVSQPCVIKDTDGYRMWYMGWDAMDKTRIGYATSYYGFDWKDHPGNPALEEGSSGSWDDGDVYDPSVLKDGSTYKMWYTGWSPTANMPRIGYAASTDGITWVKHLGPVLDLGASGTWDALGVGAPSVTKDGGQYEMWYEGEDAYGWWRIGYATSPDGINWTKHSGNPILSEGAPGSWEEWGLGGPTVVKDGATYEMWYHGLDSYEGLRIGHAVSQNGYLWTKSDENPVIDRGYGDSWDNQGIGHPSVLKNDNENIFEIWYRGVNASEQWGIGYAASSAAASPLGIGHPTAPKSTPESYVLLQNYPNPFNSSTTIKFESPARARVTLAVFNTLGQQVALLQNGEQEAGYHEITFDATGLASGVYFYRMQAGSFVETKTLLLVR